jgi:5'(3')-deoxyribonucleotidase
MTESNTFKNLSVLKEAQEIVKRDLGDKYEVIVTPYLKIIQMVMDANQINEFEALKKIKETLPIYNQMDAPMFFSAALIEITEGKHFVGFK